MLRTALAAAIAVSLLSVASAGAPAAAAEAVATLRAPDGGTIGTVELRETPHGVLLRVRLDAAPPGAHAFHIHAVGTCTPPDFRSAGGHFAPLGHEHGIANPRGKHAGDLPNVHVAGDGTLDIEILADAVSLAEDGSRASLFDDDGSAIVMHVGADDYVSNPAGDAGARIACGVVEGRN